MKKILATKSNINIGDIVCYKVCYKETSAEYYGIVLEIENRELGTVIRYRFAATITDIFSIKNNKNTVIYTRFLGDVTYREPIYKLILSCFEELME